MTVCCLHVDVQEGEEARGCLYRCVVFWTMPLWVSISVGSPIPGPGFEFLGQYLYVAWVRVLGNEKGQRKSHWSKTSKSNTQQAEGVWNMTLLTEKSPSPWLPER